MEGGDLGGYIRSTGVSIYLPRYLYLISNTGLSRLDTVLSGWLPMEHLTLGDRFGGEGRGGGGGCSCFRSCLFRHLRKYLSNLTHS